MVWFGVKGEESYAAVFHGPFLGSFRGGHDCGNRVVIGACIIMFGGSGELRVKDRQLDSYLSRE